MFMTVTPNPSLDQACFVNPKEINSDGIYKFGKDQQKISAAGGGLNVSRVAAMFKIKSIAVGFIGGSTGEHINSLLKKQGLFETRFTPIKGESRICNSINGLRKKELQLLGSGPTISPEEERRFFRNYQDLMQSVDAVVLTGSNPKGVSDNFYPDLINQARVTGKKVYVDAKEELLKQAVEYCPYLIKPNMPEFQSLINYLDPGINLSNNEDIIGAAREHLISRRGIRKVLLSLGGKGSLLISEDKYVIIRDKSKKKFKNVVNTVGCGDTLLASFIALSNKFDEKEALRRASAAAAANTLRPETAFFLFDDYEQILPLIEAEEVFN